MFYTNLAHICEQQNTNIPTLAKTLSIPRPTVYSWKRNGSTPRPQVVTKIADYLKVEPESLTKTEGKTISQTTVETNTQPSAKPAVNQTPKTAPKAAPRRTRVTDDQILSAFSMLNSTGKRTMLERARELSQLKKYAK